VPGQRLKPKTKVKEPPNGQRPIVIVGVGHMGGAFARGLIGAGMGSRLILIDPAIKLADARAFKAAGAVAVDDANVLADAAPEAIILAVKPQLMRIVAPAYADAARKALVISIAAGTPVGSLELWLKKPRALVRAMPNLPASVGKGISAAYATPTTTPVQRKLAATLLAALGELVWLDGEELMNAVTAVSGSGPAYVFLLTEALAAAGVRQGFAPDVAQKLARKTIEGVGALLASTDTEPADLRASVTSPGGTTEAALKVLTADGRFERLVADAVAAAVARGFELAKTR
jgi:pyrroline-5-carboxylate reductase